MRWGTLLLLAGSLSAWAGELPPEIAAVLAGHSIPDDSASILVQAVGAETPLLALHPEASRNPASVMKLVTTWAALETLGPAYRWPTEVYFAGPFDGHTLDGDLAIKGYGDPFLVLEEFWKMLRAVRRIGLEHIQGDLVLDDTYFEVNEPDPAAFDGQPYRAYNVPPSALLVNFKAVQFQFYADPVGRRVRVALEPPLTNLEVRNGLKLAEGPCRGYQAGIAIDIADAAKADRVVLSGAFPARCNHYELARTVLRHDTYTYGLFDALWKELGGTLRGGLRKAKLPDDARPVLTWRSPALADVIRRINKNSNNVMTRQLLYTLGAVQHGAPGTREKGVAAVRELLASRGLDTSSLVMDNGAGLSRTERVSARLLADLLLAAYASPYAAEFVSSLSLGGLDGTTRARFDGHPEEGLMHVKTGRLDHVSAVAGYVRAASGTTYVTVVLLNAPDAHRGPGEELQHAVLHWVHERG
ncbi:MAG TPA: D-alanyl-D-alanine carboxypeptidase/D-alanyl-D-alanine-endopeptidase [Gammaproteobacteria bacterium]